MAGVHALGSSSSARGLPPASVRIRSRTDSSNRPGIAVARRSRASRVGQGTDLPLRKPGKIPGRAGFPDGKDDDDALGSKPACNEPEHLCGCLVEPLRVVEEAYQGLRLCDIGEQAQHRQPHEEPIRGVACSQAERGAQCVALWVRQAVEPIDERHAELMKSGKGQLHLGLHARRAHHAAPRGVRGEILQEGGLADARIAPEHEGAARSGSCIRDQPVKRLAFGTPPPQACFGVSRPPHDSPIMPRGLFAMGATFARIHRGRPGTLRRRSVAGKSPRLGASDRSELVDGRPAAAPTATRTGRAPRASTSRFDGRYRADLV